MKKEIPLYPPRGLRRILLLLSLAAALCAVGLYIAFRVTDEKRVRSAADFGFSDRVSGRDADLDGTDDWADMVAGARAYIATGPVYRSGYFAGGYPDDGSGVCTDVIWHAFDAAGYTLKDLVDADIAADPDAYMNPGERPDPNIDFRRVRNLLVFFRRYAEELTVSLADPEDWMPGDIVIFDGHIGLCSDKRNASGIPYLIHHGSAEVGAVEENNPNMSTAIAHFRWHGTDGLPDSARG